MELIDVTGQKFGKLTALKMVRRKLGVKQKEVIYWECECECGKQKIVNSSKLRTGWTVSCGCVKGRCNITHHMTKTRPYQIWNAMKQRCSNPNTINYERYGGRNITFCDRWSTFEGFWQDMEPGYSDDLTLDRIDNSLGYSKENCVWKTPKEQARNTRKNKAITHNGVTKLLVEWAEEYQIESRTLLNRINLKWDMDKALKEPVKKKTKSRKKLS